MGTFRFNRTDDFDKARRLLRDEDDDWDEDDEDDDDWDDWDGIDTNRDTRRISMSNTREERELQNKLDREGIRYNKTRR